MAITHGAFAATELANRECLSEQQIFDWLDRRADASTTRACEAHVASCSECRSLVSELAKQASLWQPALNDQHVAEHANTSLADSGPVRRKGMALTPGTTIASKYEVDRILGKGGMGIVVSAIHTQLRQRVAIKFIGDGQSDRERTARFVREARAAARIQSEHVVRVLDFGTIEDGTPFLVMEQLEGKNLAERIAESGPLPFREAVDRVIEACNGLAAAHRLGIVHRDVKPANLFLAQGESGTTTVKVLDFGLSKITDPNVDSASLTATGHIFGSPLYMSPEQLSGPHDVDARADVWALAVTLYESIAGKPPFDGTSLPVICTQIVTQPPAKIRRIRPEVPRELERAIERALEKDRDRRFASILEFASAIAPFASDPHRLPFAATSRGTSGLWVGLGLSAIVAMTCGAGYNTLFSEQSAAHQRASDMAASAAPTPMRDVRPARTAFAEVIPSTANAGTASMHVRAGSAHRETPASLAVKEERATPVQPVPLPPTSSPPSAPPPRKDPFGLSDRK